MVDSSQTARTRGSPGTPSRNGGPLDFVNGSKAGSSENSPGKKIVEKCLVPISQNIQHIKQISSALGTFCRNAKDSGKLLQELSKTLFSNRILEIVFDLVLVANCHMSH